jgi:hypothetical protein
MATMASDTMRAVEDLLRKSTKTKRGKMQIRRLHVDKLMSSNARARDIGKPRADIIWGCVAEMISTGLHVNKDMTLTTSHLELLRARGRVAREGAPKGEAHRVELRGHYNSTLFTFG